MLHNVALWIRDYHVCVCEGCMLCLCGNCLGSLTPPLTSKCYRKWMLHHVHMRAIHLLVRFLYLEKLRQRAVYRLGPGQWGDTHHSHTGA